ncbi:hypothetical protein SGCOL_009823 [Colletotrichum sp. CLE4]
MPELPELEEAGDEDDVDDAMLTLVALSTSAPDRPQFFATDVAIISLNLSELAVQKQPYDVVLPPSPHPATMSRTMELMGGSAHDGSESYPSAWLR